MRGSVPFLSKRPSVSTTLKNPADICESFDDVGTRALWAAKVGLLS